MKLFQKHLLKGAREFEIVGEEVQYKIKSPLRTEELTVLLHVLDPKPVISGSMLSFESVINREPLVEFFLDNPDKESFDAFIDFMRKRITEEDFSRLRVTDKVVNVNVGEVRTAIDMLRTYADPADIGPLLTALEALEAKPEEVQCLNDLADAFNNLGFAQGSVLTYAPYINALLDSNDHDEAQEDSYS